MLKTRNNIIQKLSILSRGASTYTKNICSDHCINSAGEYAFLVRLKISNCNKIDQIHYENHKWND